MRALRAFVAGPDPETACDLCGAPIAAHHDHVIDRESAELSCVCRGCALLFDHPASPRRRVEPRAERIADVEVSDAEWASLGVPIDLAFFVRERPGDPVIARYPSPAGPVRAELLPGAYERLETAHPALALGDDPTCAIAVWRGGGQIWRLSVDRCYRLVGALRSRWRGMTGGAAARAAIRDFFAELEPGGAGG